MKWSVRTSTTAKEEAVFVLDCLTSLVGVPTNQYPGIFHEVVGEDIDHRKRRSGICP
jgi:hypothetical protein